MRIVYIGGNIGDGSPPHATENAYADAFRALGHQVEPVPQHSVDAAGFLALPWDIDLVLYTRTHNATALTAGWTDVWRKLEARGTHTAGIHLDVFVGLPEREEWVMDGDPLFTTEFLFTPDGGSEDFWAEQKVNHVWLPPACDTRAIPAERGLKFLPRINENDFLSLDGKVVFVGSKHYHPQWPHRPQLIRHLRQRYGERFVIFGKDSPYGAHRDPMLTAIYRSDCIVVGDHCFAGERPYYWSDRVPETLGRGGLLVHPLSPGMRDWYTASDLVYWRADDFTKLDEQIAYLDEVDPEDRAAMRRAGETRVLRGCGEQMGGIIPAMPEAVAGRWSPLTDWRGFPDTYEQRAKQVLDVIFGKSDA